MRTLLQRLSTLRPLALVLVGVLATAACSTSDPNSPTSPIDLTGNNPNANATFNGTISVQGGGAVAPADGATDIFFAVSVLDVNGNPAANGTPVDFFTDLGTIRLAGADPLAAATSLRLATFEGRAAVVVRSAVPGIATVTAAIADVIQVSTVTFERVPLAPIVDLNFVVAGGATKTFVGTAPQVLETRATVTDATGVPLVAVPVRFKKVFDNTVIAAKGAADFIGPRRSLTDTTGRASVAIDIPTEGQVVLQVEVLDPADNLTILATSNNVTSVTTARQNTVAVALTFTGGATVTEAVVGATTGLVATVIDTSSSSPLIGAKVLFRIISDTSEVDRAVLAQSGTSLTDDSGIAINAVAKGDPGAIIVLEAQFIEPETGDVGGSSNQIVLTLVPPDIEEGGN